jgi:heme exporter protein D
VKDFFAMGGYAAYVWPAFGFAAAVLIGLLWQSWRAARRRELELDQLRRTVRPGAAGRQPMRPIRPQVARLASDVNGAAASRDASA